MKLGGRVFAPDLLALIARRSRKAASTKAHAAITGDLLERAHDICDRLGDGAEDGYPLEQDALKLADDIKAALRDKP